MEAWAGLVGQKEARIIAASGSEEDNRRELEILSRDSEVVLDLTALLTTAYLELFDHLSKRFSKIYVSQAVLDELNEVLAKSFIGARPTLSVGKEGDQYVRKEVTSEDLERGRKFLETIRSFVESRVEIVPTSSILDFGKERFEKLAELIGRGAVASILTAQERKIPLYSDDFRLRLVTKNDWQVEGVWSQSVLLNMRSRGLLKDNEYHSSVRKLALANYYFVSIDAEGLMWILKQNSLTITEEVERVFELLEGPDCTEESAVRVMADLIKRIWLEVPFYHQKLSIVDLALKTLTTGRAGNQVLVRLKASLQSRFALMPLALPTIFESIDVWERQRLTRSGLLGLKNY